MTPFDLPGPAFLVFYVILGALLLGAVAIVRHVIESGPVPRVRDVDPYLIAHLRGGPNEAMRVATLSLLDRGLLEADGEELQAQKGAQPRVRRGIERALLAEFKTAKKAKDMFRASGTRASAATLEDELRKQRLLPDTRQRLVRLALGLGALAILWWFGVHKIQIAFSRGRDNIGFLFLMMCAAPVVGYFILRTRRTALGTRLIHDLQILFSGLRDRAVEIESGGATNELALLAGIFGLRALSGPALEQAKTLFPAATASNSASPSGSSCGASCGSASSCGGGGSSCGGGCGGCGGGCGG